MNGDLDNLDSANGTSEDWGRREWKFNQPTERNVTELVKERGTCYGTPYSNHSCTAGLFTLWLRRRYGVKAFQLDWRDVCAFNILQKLSRDAFSLQTDNWRDIEGYARNVLMVIEELQQNQRNTANDTDRR